MAAGTAVIAGHVLEVVVDWDVVDRVLVNLQGTGETVDYPHGADRVLPRPAFGEGQLDLGVEPVVDFLELGRRLGVAAFDVVNLELLQLDLVEGLIAVFLDDRQLNIELFQFLRVFFRRVRIVVLVGQVYEARDRIDLGLDVLIGRLGPLLVRLEADEVGLGLLQVGHVFFAKFARVLDLLQGVLELLFIGQLFQRLLLRDRDFDLAEGALLDLVLARVILPDHPDDAQQHQDVRHGEHDIQRSLLTKRFVACGHASPGEW